MVAELSNGVALIIEMMMAKNPKDRYQNASQLLEDLEVVSEGNDPIHARSSHSLADALAHSSPPGAETSTEVRQLNSASSGISWKLLLVGGLLVGSLIVNLALLLLRSRTN